MKNQNKFFIWLVIAMILGLVILIATCRYTYAPATNLLGSQNSDNLSVLKQSCGIENCHGLDIVCGPNIPKQCTSEYQIGDSCRRYVRCQIQNGKCQLLRSDKFNECKNCVEKCETNFKKSNLKLLQCEGDCHLKINQTKKAVME